MSKKIRSKESFLVCSVCSKAKSTAAYTLKWQLQKAVCNYCREFSPFSAQVVTQNNKKTDRAVSCLRCDKTFKGRANVRICTGCKSTEAYKDDQLFQYFTTGAIA